MRLESSQELLERLRTAYDGASYYRVAKLIGCSEAAVAHWKHGRSGIGREYVTRVAELLDEAPEYILACVEHEREQDPGARKLWERIAEQFRTHAAIILLALMLVLGFGNPTPAEASDTHPGSGLRDNVYYGKRRTRRSLSLAPA